MMWPSLLWLLVVSSCRACYSSCLAPHEQFAGAEGRGQWPGESAGGGVTYLAPVPSRLWLVGSLLDPWGEWLAPV